MTYLKKKKLNRKKTKILLQTRSNFWGSSKFFRSYKKRWLLLRKQYSLKLNCPESLYLETKQLKPRYLYQKLLKKKQIFKLFYGNLKESQIKKLFKTKNKNKISLIIRQLESRLDLILYRSGLVHTLYEARQLIKHKKIYINESCVYSKNYILKPKDILFIDYRSKTYIYNQLAYKMYNIYYVLSQNFLRESRFCFKPYLKFLSRKFRKAYNRCFRARRGTSFRNLFLKNNNFLQILLIQKFARKPRTLFRKKRKYSTKIKSNTFYWGKNRRNFLTFNNKYNIKTPQKAFFSLYYQLNSVSYLIMNTKYLIVILAEKPSFEFVPFFANLEFNSILRYYNRILI